MPSPNQEGPSDGRYRNQDGSICGSAAGSSPWTTCTSGKPARDRGVGRQLMTAVASIAAPEQLLIVWGARAENEGGHRFYRRLGARITIKAAISWTPENYRWATGSN